VVRPASETVSVYEPGRRDPRVLHPGDAVEGGEVMPGFSMPIEAVFEV